MKIVNEKGMKTHQIVESCRVIDGTRFKNHLELLKIDGANVYSNFIVLLLSFPHVHSLVNGSQATACLAFDPGVHIS